MSAAQRSSQLVLDLPHRIALGREDFLVSPSNAKAVDWIDRWPDWPGGILALSGPKACGKSHLIEVWRARSGAGLITASEVSGDSWLALDAGMAVDDMASLNDEAALLHAINWSRQKGSSLLLAGELPPSAWDVRLPDLKSRLATIQVAEVAAPDDALLEAIMVKQFADRQLSVTPEVIAYLRARIDRSFEAVRQVVERLDLAALAEKRAITLPFVRRTLNDGESPGRDLA